jgi:hypothetical protein
MAECRISFQCDRVRYFEGEGSRVSVVFNNHEMLVNGALREGKTSNAFVKDVLEKAVSEENKKIS